MFKNVLVGYKETALILSMTATVMLTEMNGDFSLFPLTITCQMLKYATMMSDHY